MFSLAIIIVAYRLSIGTENGNLGWPWTP